MRKIILLTVAITFFLTPNYSQLYRPLNLFVPEFKYPVETLQKPNTLGNSYSYKDFKQHITPKINSVSHALLQLNLSYRYRLNETSQSPILYDNMPCYKPPGYYPIYTYVPDSTVRYSLLIKKLN